MKLSSTKSFNICEYIVKNKVWQAFQNYLNCVNIFKFSMQHLKRELALAGCNHNI